VLERILGAWLASSLKDAPSGDYVNKGKAALEHHFDNHNHCGDWCPRKNKTQAERDATKKRCRCKNKDAKLCVLLEEMLLNYVAFERLSDVAHGMDTNCCEAFNNFMTWFAPKNKVYCGSRSLWNRVGLCIGIASLGCQACFQRLLKSLGIAMTPNVFNFLSAKDRSRSKRLELAKEKDSKKKRNKRKCGKLVEHTTIARKERARRDGYKSGMNLETIDVGPGVVASTDAQPKPRAKHPVNVCLHPFCQKRGHKTTKSKHCLANPDRLKREGLEAACLAAIAAVTESDDAAQEAASDDDNNMAAANDLDEHESQPFEEFEEDLFCTSGTWLSDYKSRLVMVEQCARCDAIKTNLIRLRIA